VSLLVAASAAILGIGAVVAASAREGRVAVLGLAVVLVAAPLVMDPLPSVTVLAIRLTGSVLAAYLIHAALRSEPSTLGTHLGWPVQALAAIAAGVVGFGIAAEAALGLVGLGAETDPAGGATVVYRPAALALHLGVAAGAATIVLSIEPIVAARDSLRLGIGLLLALTGLTVIREALVGPAGGLEHIVIAATIAAIAAATAVVCLGATASGDGLALTRIPRSIRARRPGLRQPLPLGPEEDRGDPP